jgi:predicted PurR-regulated permease PerM
MKRFIAKMTNMVRVHTNSQSQESPIAESDGSKSSRETLQLLQPQPIASIVPAEETSRELLFSSLNSTKQEKSQSPVGPNPPMSPRKRSSGTPKTTGYTPIHGPGYSMKRNLSNVTGLLWKEEHTVKSAVIHATVYLLIAVSILVLYYNYILLGPYFSVIFWAALVSIPLHKLKRTLVQLMTTAFSIYGVDQSQNRSQNPAGNPVGNIDGAPGFFSVCFALMVLILEFLLGPAWAWIASGPRWYLFQINRIREYQYRRQKQFARRFLRPGIVSMSLSNLNLESRQINSGNTSKRSNPILSLHEKLLDSISKAPSGIYFIYLFRTCGWYIIGSFLWNHVTFHQIYWLLFTSVAGAFVHLVCIFLLSAYHIYISPGICYSFRVIQRIGVWIDANCWNIFSIIREKISAFLFNSKKIYIEMKEDMKQETIKQLHSVVSGMILVVFIGLSLVMSAFLLFQFAHEGHMLVDKTVTMVNQTVLYNDYVRDLQLQEQLQGTVRDFTAKGISWADSQLNEKFPGYNMSVNMLYEKALQTYSFIFHPPKHKQSRVSVSTLTLFKSAPIPSKDIPNGILPQESTDGLFSNGNPNKASHSSAGDNTDDKFTRFLSKEFPETIRLCRETLNGNFSVWMSFGTVKASFTELKTGLIRTTQSFFKNDREYMEEILKSFEEKLFDIGQWILSNSTVIFSYASVILLAMIDFFMYSFHLLAQAALFFATLYYLLLPEQDVLEHMGQLLIHVDTNQVLKTSIEKAISAVFITTLKMFTFHALFTWLTFNLFDLSFVYMISFATGFISIVPITSPTWLVLPGCIELYLRNQPISAILLISSHYLASWFVDPAIYCDIPDSHPYFSAMSIVLGLWAFGWQGIVLGPLLACLPVVIFHLYSEMIQ